MSEHWIVPFLDFRHVIFQEYFLFWRLSHLCNRIIYTFPPVFWYFLVQCPMPGSSAHTSSIGMGSPWPKPAVMWYSSLGSGGCGYSHVRGVKKPCCRHSTTFLWRNISAEPLHFVSWTLLQLVLCPATSLARPDPLACLPGQASDLPCHCGMTLVMMDWSWPWFLSPDLLCLSCLSVCAASLASEGTAPASVVVTPHSWLASSCRGGCP